MNKRPQDTELVAVQFRFGLVERAALERRNDFVGVKEVLALRRKKVRRKGGLSQTPQPLCLTFLTVVHDEDDGFVGRNMAVDPMDEVAPDNFHFWGFGDATI